MIQEGVVTTIATDRYAVGAFLGYLAIIVGIGFYSARFSSTGISEFFVGGRRMNRFVVALSAVVSGRSAWLLLAVTGMAYSRGASALWAVVGYTTVELLLFLYYAPRLRDFSETHDCVTVTDYFAARFPARARALRGLIATVILVFMVAYVSSQFVAGGKAFGASFGLGATRGVIFTALIVLAYTALGGFLAVSLTDMLQAIFMVFALLVLPTVAIVHAGGISELAAVAPTDPGFLDPGALGLGTALGFVGIGLGSPGNPHILVRYMSIDDSAQLRVSALVGTTWNVLMGGGAILIGLVGRYYFPEVAALPGADTENLYPALAQQHLHPILFGVVVASIFAAIMSTADSQLLVAVSALVHDLYEKNRGRRADLSARQLVLLSRIGVVVLVAAALALGFLSSRLVFWLVLFAWAGLGATLGPTSILALFWRRTTGTGVIAGVVAGGITTIGWYLSPLKPVLYELIPGFLAGLLVTWSVSLMTSREVDPPSREHLSG